MPVVVMCAALAVVAAGVLVFLARMRSRWAIYGYRGDRANRGKSWESTRMLVRCYYGWRAGEQFVAVGGGQNWRHFDDPNKPVEPDLCRFLFRIWSLNLPDAPLAGDESVTPIVALKDEA